MLSLHLAEIGKQVATGAHAVLVLDGGGYHVAHDLLVPENSPSSSCRPVPPSPIPSRPSGSPCARTSGPSPSLTTLTTFSTPAAKPGISSQTTKPSSYPSQQENGQRSGIKAVGLSYHQAIDLIAGAARRGRIVGMDMVELLPVADLDGLSALTSSRILVNAIGAIVRQRQPFETSSQCLARYAR